MSESNVTTLKDIHAVLIVGRRRNSSTEVLIRRMQTCMENANAIPTTYRMKNTYDESLAQSILAQQEFSNAKPVMVCFDDSLGREDLDRPSFQKLLAEGKRLNIFVVVNMDFCLFLPPSIRQHFVFVYGLKESHDHADVLRIYNQFKQPDGITEENVNLAPVFPDSGCNQENQSLYEYFVGFVHKLRPEECYYIHVPTRESGVFAWFVEPDPSAHCQPMQQKTS